MTEDPILLPALEAATLGFLVYLLGALITRRIGFLRDFNIPEPVTGGLLAALVTLGIHAVWGRPVLFDLTILAAAGGSVPVADGLAYRYQLRPGQATDTEGGRFDAEYVRALGLIAADGAGFGRHAGDAAGVLRRWRAMNRLVGGGGSRPGLGDYHRAVAAYLAGAWPAGRRRRAGET